MRSEFLDEIGDTLFAVAVAGAIGLSAANLAIQVNKERAAFDSSAASHILGQLAYPQQRGTPDTPTNLPVTSTARCPAFDCSSSDSRRAGRML
jgi:hypothetical protein